MKKVTLSVVGGILAFLTLWGGGILGLELSNPALATTASSSKHTKVSIDPIIAITALDNYNLHLSPTSTGVLTTASGVVTVSTNNATGYNLYLSMDNDDTNALVNTAKAEYTIPTISNPITATEFPNNHWGYSLDTPTSLTNFLPLPAVNNTSLLKATDGPAAISNTDFSVGVKADTSTASGTYKNTIKFTATINEPPVFTPKAILGDNGNLNFVYDTNTYKVDDYYDDNLGHTQIKAVYDVPYNATATSPPAWTGTEASPRTDITSANFTQNFYYFQPATLTYWFCYDTQISHITNAQNVDTSNATSLRGAFGYTGRDVTDSFTIEGLDSWETSSVTNMQAMFYIAGQNASTWSVGDLGNWDTGNVTNMSYIFHAAGQNASTWDIGDIGSWDTSSVTNMQAMFGGRNATNWSVGDLSGWDTGKVTDMSHMFEDTGMRATNIWDVGDISHWDVSNVTTMYAMFYRAGNGGPKFSLDLSGWDTSNVTNMKQVFSNATKLQTVFVGDGWDTGAVTDGTYMFGGATSLVGGAGTTYSSAHTDKEYARVDNPPDAPGYFTYRGSNPVTPGGGGENGGENVVNNITNTFNNIFNNNNNNNNNDTDTTEDPASGYVEPMGVVNTTNNSPNWFLIICLLILSLGLIVLIVFFAYKLYKQRPAKN